MELAKPRTQGLVAQGVRPQVLVMRQVKAQVKVPMESQRMARHQLRVHLLKALKQEQIAVVALTQHQLYAIPHITAGLVPLGRWLSAIYLNLPVAPGKSKQTQFKQKELISNGAN